MSPHGTTPHATIVPSRISGSLRVAIALCTWNRADSLRRTLASFEKLVAPEAAEVVVILVDNNSTDDTAHVAANAPLPFPREVVFERTPGLSNARNAAVARARALGAEFILFTDDDVEVDALWVAEYARAFAAHPETIVFGGPIIPRFEVEPAPWMQRNMSAFRGPFVLMDMGPVDRKVGLEFDTPYGANMAFRTDALPPDPFDPALGVAPGRRMGGEETHLSRSLLTERNGQWVYIARAPVTHHLPGKVVDTDYLYMHFRSFGHFVARDGERTGDGVPRRLPPRWLCRAYAQTWLLRRLWWPTRSFAGPYARLFSEEAAYRGQMDMYMTSADRQEKYDR